MVGRIAAMGSLAALLACAPAEPGPVEPVAEPMASYLTDDLVQVTLDYTGNPDALSVKSLTDCAAAEAVALRGAGFVRHVRTTLTEEAGISRADAVYTVSPTRPAGDFVIDAEAVASDCRDQGTTGV